MLEFALRYAAFDWFIFPLHLIVNGRCGCGKPDCQSPGKHPRIKWKDGATCDEYRVREYWGRWPNAGIGLACGPSGLLVADADGSKGVEALRALVASQPGSLATARARTARGVHVFYRGEGRTRSDPETKLDTRGVGGFVVLAPSPHVSGHVYRWEVEPWEKGAIAEAPAALVAYSQGGKKRGTLGEGRVGGTSTAPWTQTPSREIGASADFTMKLGGCLVDWHEVDRALACIPPDVGYDQWVHVGMALHAAGDTGERWDQWSARGEKYKDGETGQKWISFKQVPDGIGLGSLFVIAHEYGYERDMAENTGRASVSKEINGHNVLVDSSLALPESFNASPISGLADSCRFPDVSEGGKVKATCANAIEAIKGLGIACEGDRFHERYRVGGQVMEQWAGELSDAMVQIVRVLIRERFQFDPGKQHTGDALEQECLCHSYHPIKNYFDLLQWDGVKRLDTWMIRYLGAADDVFNRQVSRLSLVAAVRRVLQPGCKFDHIIVLEGPEGRGKSSAIEILAGSENFSDQSILTLDDKGQQEAVQGVWLYEIADLAGHSRAEVERVKAFVSRTTDRARPAYGRHRVDRSRTCVFFATTNDRTYLKSQTGNRRFLPAECGAIDLEGLRRDRNQLWAEALVIERADASLVLDPKLWSVAAERQESRRDHDPWDDKLEHLHKHTSCKTTKSGVHKIWSRDILDAVLQIPITQQGDVVSKRLAYALRRLGWDGPKLVRIMEEVGRGYTKTVTRPSCDVTEIDEYIQRGNS